MFLSGISGTNTASRAATDSTALNDNFDTFLQLLTTQLRNQNPMEPLDANEFTKQLVQYSSVEQEIRSNKNLETLIGLQVSNAATAATSFMGKAVAVESTVSTLGEDGARWQYTSGGPAESAVFTVTDDSGNTVYEELRPLEAGSGSFTWDGRTGTGQAAPQGAYTLTVDARDAADAVIPVSLSVSAIIDGVDFSGNEPVLLSGNRGVPISQVRSVAQP